MCSSPIHGVNVIAFVKGSFGLAQSARSCIKALSAANIPFNLLSADFLVPEHFQESFDLPVSDSFRYPVNLFCLDSPNICRFIETFPWSHFASRYNIGVAFWETNVIPYHVSKAWVYLDEVWGTTTYVQEHLSAVCPKPVYRITQPVESPVVEKKHLRSDFSLSDDFIFYFNFNFGSVMERKNPLAVIKAFRRAFPEKNLPVQLVIKSQMGHLFSDQKLKCLQAIEGEARIKWIDESMTLEKSMGLMSLADCYVSLHRSEGFGLTMAGALMLEKPVITTPYSGNIDFTHPDTCYLPHCRLKRIGKGHPPYPAQGIWAEVDIDHAAALMRHVYEHPQEAKSKALAGKAYLLKHHSLEAVGEEMRRRLQAVQGAIAPKKPPFRYNMRNVRKRLAQGKRLLVRIKNKIKRTLGKL